jgi:acyl-CoA synthetase (AMP-forming)/AMP-acid ligase II
VDIVKIHAESSPDKPALIQGDRSFTWLELLGLRNRLANSLQRLGFESGEHAVVYSHNSIEYMLAGQAVRALGGISVPVNHRLTPEEVSYILENADATTAFVGDEFVPMAEKVRSLAPRVRSWILVGEERRPWAHHIQDLIDQGDAKEMEIALSLTEGLGGSMIYTAGTTGKPKGARRTNVDASLALTWLQTFDLADSSHIHLIAGPLYHSAPAAFATFAVLAGSTCVIMPKFDPEEALQLIEKHRCTSTMMAPTLVKRILDLPEETRKKYDVSSLRVLIVAGAPCPMDIKQRANDYFGPVLYEFYGSTELGINTILRPEDVLRKPGSCGKAPPQIELGVFDEEGKQLPTGEIGELYIRRYVGMFDGYYKNPQATAETAMGDWASVGDIAYMDDEGFVYVCDRKRDMIISGGVNIYSAEIEDVLHGHPKIRDAAVFGVPDDEWGERVHAAIQLKPGDSMTEDEVCEFARQHLAGYKAPREVSFHEDFPRDSAGKLVKRFLKEPYWAGRETRV